MYGVVKMCHHKMYFKGFSYVPNLKLLKGKNEPILGFYFFALIFLQTFCQKSVKMPKSGFWKNE